MEGKMTKKQKSPTRKAATQADFVLDYLLRCGAKGATNFEMMMKLKICDVRKCISEINNTADSKYSIASEFETNEKSHSRYKRYYAYERKRTNKARKLKSAKKR